MAGETTNRLMNSIDGRIMEKECDKKIKPYAVLQNCIDMGQKAAKTMCMSYEPMQANNEILEAQLISLNDPSRRDGVKLKTKTALRV